MVRAFDVHAAHEQRILRLEESSSGNGENIAEVMTAIRILSSKVDSIADTVKTIPEISMRLENLEKIKRNIVGAASAATLAIFAAIGTGAGSKIAKAAIYIIGP